MRRLVNLTAGLVLGALLVAAQPASFKVIVNAQNPVSSLAREELSRIFLKRTVRWESGQTMLPIDLAVTSPVRDSFSETIHGRRAAAIKSYWQQQIYSGRGVPPPEGGSEEEVVTFVRNNPGGVGYVSAGARLDGVKVVEVTG